jgi:hypothetical protein
MPQTVVQRAAEPGFFRGCIEGKTQSLKGSMMSDVADSIVVKRLVRNLRYKLTYIRVFETFLERAPHPVAAKLMQSLIRAQQTAVVPLTDYVESLGVDTQDLGLDEKLQKHAAARNDFRSQLYFVHYGLTKASSWYKTQLMDGQMTADPQLRLLLLNLGEIDAASLWRTEAVMVTLRIPVEPVSADQRKDSRRQPAKVRDWQSRPRGRQRRPVWKRD